MPLLLAQPTFALDSAGNILRDAQGRPIYQTAFGLLNENQIATTLAGAGYTGSGAMGAKWAALNQLAQNPYVFAPPSPVQAPLVNNCSQCGGGQNTGACAGCAPYTPPGSVSTGTNYGPGGGPPVAPGTPVSTTSGIPLGGGLGRPTKIGPVSLPLWLWGVGASIGYFVLRGRRRR